MKAEIKINKRKKLPFPFCSSILIILALVLCTGMTNQTKTEQETIQKGQLHIIIDAQDDKTEVDISVNGKAYDNMILNKGLNFIPYKIKTTKPSVEILSYGDTLKPNIIKKKYNNYYTYLKIAPPKDGDGNKFNDN